MSHCPTLPPCWRATVLYFWFFLNFHSSIGWSHTGSALPYHLHTDNFQINISSPVFSPELQMCMSGCPLHTSTWHLRHRAELLSLPSPQTCSTPSNPHLSQWWLHSSSGSGQNLPHPNSKLLEVLLALTSVYIFGN